MDKIDVKIHTSKTKRKIKGKEKEKNVFRGGRAGKYTIAKIFSL